MQFWICFSSARISSTCPPLEVLEAEDIYQGSCRWEVEGVESMSSFLLSKTDIRYYQNNAVKQWSKMCSIHKEQAHFRALSLNGWGSWAHFLLHGGGWFLGCWNGSDMRPWIMHRLKLTVLVCPIKKEFTSRNLCKCKNNPCKLEILHRQSTKSTKE